MSESTATLRRIEEEAVQLPPNERLELVEHLVRSLRPRTTGDVRRSWRDLYGIGKGLWTQDAQDYVTQLREDRQ